MVEATGQASGGDEPRDVGGVMAATDPEVVAARALTPTPASAKARVIALYEAHGEELHRFVLGVVRNSEVADDVLQAAFSKALELGHTARPETIKGWLFRVAYHEALVWRRRERAGTEARRRIAALGAPGRPAAVDGLIREETVAAVRAALQMLPDDQRRVVMARVYDDKTFAEIARESGLPLGTVLTRMRLALAKLRIALQAAGPGTDRETER